MKKRSFEVYRCKLVREKTIEYVGHINRPSDVADAANAMGFSDFAEEVFAIFDVDTKGKIIGYHEISHGDLNSAQIHPREIFKRAIVNNSAGIVLVHNHPSGDATPSEDDIKVTKRIVEAGHLLGIPVVDHIIIGDKSRYYSLKSEGDF